MSRVAEHIKVKASTLIPNPRNWRIHSPEQEGVMREIIDRLGGMAGSVHAYHSERYGGLTLIDGHMRRELAGDEDIDVEVLDVDDKEADLLLATFDPVSDMATRDQAMLDSVLASIDLTGLDEMLAELDVQVDGIIDSGYIDREGDDRAGASPWDRVGNASEGVMFAFGAIQKRINADTYKRFASVVSIDNIEEVINEMCNH